MHFRLHYAQHNFELPLGAFVLGRSPECQLSLDDPLVSRRHARLLVTDTMIFIEDLGSRNGVLIDGVKLEGKQRLVEGQRVVVGSQELWFVRVEPSRPSTPSWRITSPGEKPIFPWGGEMSALPEPGANASSSLRGTTAPASHDDVPTKTVDSLRLLGGVADKAMALGHTEEAERILSIRLQSILEEARRQPTRVLQTVVDDASKYALRLGKSTGKGEWIDFIVELHTIQARPLAATIVDELYTVVRNVSPINLAALRAYQNCLHARTGDFNATEKFLLQRIDGLERLAAAK